METTVSGLSQLVGLIAWPYLACFVLLSSLFKRIFGDWLQRITKFEWKQVYTVAIIALVIGILYFFFIDRDWVSILVTYGLGTSFHELFWKYIEKAIRKKFEEA